MALTSEKLSRMADHQRRLMRRQADELAMRKARAHEEVRTLVAKFRTADPAISKIVLFGSLAREDVSSPDFDIDLAVSCTPESFLTLVAIALDSPFPVDVVDLATADDRIKTAVAKEGVVLYEQ